MEVARDCKQKTRSKPGHIVQGKMVWSDEFLVLQDAGSHSLTDSWLLFIMIATVTWLYTRQISWRTDQLFDSSDNRVSYQCSIYPDDDAATKLHQQKSCYSLRVLHNYGKKCILCQCIVFDCSLILTNGTPAALKSGLKLSQMNI